jgi:putative toxin-antitoxin system antitoxin component (TIGR02293 family)
LARSPWTEDRRIPRAESAPRPAASVPAIAPESDTRLSVSLVGRLTLRFNGRLIKLRTQKAGALLCYLALTETKQESRERLAGLLWSRSDEEKARRALRHVVRELRCAFDDAGYSGFTAGRLSIGLDADKVDVDVESVVRAAESGSVHPLLINTEYLDERILEGVDDLDPSFRTWVLAKRHNIHDRLMRTLDTALVAKDIATDLKKEIATAIVNLDPTHEPACCYLMQLHAEEGNIGGALRIYKSLWDLLDRDYGMEPSLATVELVSKIKLGAFEQPTLDPSNTPGLRSTFDSHRDQADPPVTAKVRAPVKTPLVLRPFTMHGVDNDQAQLIRGFQQHLTASLVRLQWSVVDRASTPAANHLVATAAPQYSIYTTTYQEGADVYVVMVLQDDMTGAYIWSESFRLDASNRFEVQRRIIRRIATSLNVQLSAERLMRLAGESDVPLDIQDHQQSLMAKFDPESWQRAAIFLEAIRENPTPATEELVAKIRRGPLEQSFAKDQPPPALSTPANLSPRPTDVLFARSEVAQGRQDNERLRDIADLLGGPKVVGKYPTDPLAAHELLERGIPNTAIKHLLEGMTTLAQKSIESAIGMSVRTRQRREKYPTELLSQDQAGRAWKFAEILARATSAFGSRTAAEQWLAQPATGLDQRRPIDLLTTPAGVELVEDFLGRIEYGVYT